MKIISSLKNTAVITFLIITGCSGLKEIESNIPIEQISIDGIQNEWEGKLNFDTKSKVAAGFMNDGGNLYICLTTGDRSNIMKILRLGLTVWLEPSNGKKIGIKYPQPGTEPPGIEPFLQEMPGNIEENPDERFHKMISKFNELSIVNEDDYPLYLLRSDDEQNIKAKIGLTQGRMVYEIKIPLSSNRSAKYFVEASPPETILVGIETNQFKIESPSGRPAGGMNTTSGRQPGGGRRQGGMQGGRNPEMNMDPLELWFRVLLYGGN